MNLDQISIFAYAIIIFASNAEATSSCLQQWLRMEDVKAGQFPSECISNEDYANYAGNDIDFVENIDYLEDCQEECQKHSECQFWTWNFSTRRCWRKTVNAPKNLDSTCDTCTSGPRDCKTKKNFEITNDTVKMTVQVQGLNYSFEIPTIDEEDNIYFFNNEPIFINENGNKCLWKQNTGLWWAGNCEDIGQNKGLKFIESCKCPWTSHFDGKNQDYQCLSKGGCVCGPNVIDGIIRVACTCTTVGDVPTHHSSTESKPF